MQAGDKWEEWEYKILRENYGKITNTELNKLLPHRGIHTLRKRANILGLKGSMALHSFKYSVNYNYFDEPNVENCYWAGYIAADGCLMGRRNDALRFACAENDKEILENFKIAVSGNQPIKIYKGKILHRNGKVYQCSPITKLDIWGVNRWHLKLKEHWNITPRKSLRLKNPNLKNLDHIVAFIIGYIDGDGACYFTKAGKYKAFVLGLCGTHTMMKWVVENIHKLRPDLTFKGNIHLNGNSETNYKIVWTAKLAREIHNTLKNYVNIPFKLKRKWDIDYGQSSSLEIL